MSEKEKYLQIRREAMWTGITLLILIVFWVLAGFGLVVTGGALVGELVVGVFAVAGTFGVWIFAMVLVKLLTTFVFKDIDLETDGTPSRKGGQP